jgi:membrane-bound inhibitor of C-type lysozyme
MNKSDNRSVNRRISWVLFALSGLTLSACSESAREACGADHISSECLALHTEKFDLQLKARVFEEPRQGVYHCDDQSRPELLVSFYPDATPPAAVIDAGDERVVAFVSRSASGARYQAQDLTFWEHQGEATVQWAGDTLTCVATGPER